MYQIENYIFAMNSLLNPTFHFQMISNYFLLRIWYNIISYFRWCQIVAFPESYREYFTRPVVLSLILAIWVLRCCPFQQKNTEKFENTENILKSLAIWVLRCYCQLQQQKCAEEAYLTIHFLSSTLIAVVPIWSNVYTTQVSKQRIPN